MLWNPVVEFSFVVLDYLAAAGVVVLAERESHFGATYEICGTGGVSHEAVSGIVGEPLGCRVLPRQKGMRTL